MTAVTLLDTPSGGMSRLGDRANGRKAAHRSGVIGTYLASPDPDRNMIKTGMTIAAPQFVLALD